MGEDFIEKKNRQFKRCTDAAYQDWKVENLFSTVPPDMSSQVVGFMTAAVTLEVGDEVMHIPMGGDSASCLSFYHGATLAVQLFGEAAAFAYQATNETTSPLTAEVVAISQDGLVTLCLHKPYKV